MVIGPYPEYEQYEVPALQFLWKGLQGPARFLIRAQTQSRVDSRELRGGLYYQGATSLGASNPDHSEENQEKRTWGRKTDRWERRGRKEESLLLGGGSAAPGLRWTNQGRKKYRARGFLNWNPSCAVYCLWVLSKWFYLSEPVLPPWHNRMRTQML